MPCPLASTTAAVTTALVWHMAGSSDEGPAAMCLGETQKILGCAKGKVKQIIYFQAEQSDVCLCLGITSRC